MLGIDIVKIERIANLYAKKGFVERFFTPYEANYALNKANSATTLAGIFASKEACVKALKGTYPLIKTTDINILHSENGCPYALFNGHKLQISISHDGDYAVAVALLIRD